MGSSENVDIDRFPEQGPLLHREVNVAFGFKFDSYIRGRVVRDDRDEPYLTIIRLNDGRYILSTECQYSI